MKKSNKYNKLYILFIITILLLIISDCDKQTSKKNQSFTASKSTKINNDFFFEAVKNNDLKNVKIAINNNIDINSLNKNGKSPVHIAAFNGHKDMLAFLIDNGANINILDSSNISDFPNKSVLHYIGTNDISIDIFEIIKHKADINLGDDTNYTPLLWAMSLGNYKAVKLFIKNGANINLHADDYMYPIHLTINPLFSKTESISILQMLIKNGADVNAKNKTTFTLLHIAARIDNVDIGRILIENNANINARTDKDYIRVPAKSTPLKVAILYNSKGMIKLLKEHNAK